MPAQIEGFRLSPQQRRLWLLQEGGPAYRAQCAVLLEGDLDAESLKDAVHQIVNRHEALRTTFHSQSGLRFPLQVDAESAAPSWHFVNLNGEEAPQQEASIEELFRDELRRPCDLGRGPTLSCCLLSLSARRHILILSLPALCADAWTLKNLVDEIVEAYARPRGEEDVEEAVPYAQFAEWQNGLLEDADGEAGRRYWRQRAATTPPALALPFESRPPVQARFEPDVFALSIDPRVVAGLDRVAARYNASAADFLLACWQTLLWRLTGEPEIIVGWSSPCRKYDDLRGAFGLLAKTVPIQTQLKSGLPFNEVLSRACETTREAEAWQEYFTWEDDTAPAPGADQPPPFFPVCFDFEAWPEGRRAAGISASLYKRHACTERYKARLSCVRANGSLTAEFHYDRDCFQVEHLKPIARHFATLLESAVENPTAMIDELEVVGEADRHQLLVAFNETESVDVEDRCLHEMFEAQAARTPDAVAVVAAGRRLTFAALDARANRLAHFLRRRGLGPDTPVALCLERSPDLLVALLAALKAGGAYLPLDPEQPPARSARQLAEAGAPVLLTHREWADRWPGFAGLVIALDEERPVWLGQPATTLARTTALDNLAYVIYTSGSTGAPKGIGVTHRGAANYTRAVSRRLDLGGGVAGLHLATVSTVAADLGNTSIFAALAGGGCLHLVAREEAMGPDEFASYLRREPVDMVKIVPSHLAALLGSQGSAVPGGLRTVVSGGEALSWELAAAVSGGGCRVLNHYGPAEATVGSLTYRVGAGGGRVGGAGGRGATVPIGRPLANTRAYIFDGRWQAVPAGVTGELYVGGEGLARGYLKRPELTAERFVPDPLSGEAGARLYKTGDLARYRPDGEIEFLGRVDQQVKVRGFRVELGEVEAALGTHASVREAVVLAREDTPGDRRLVAYVVAGHGQAPASSDLYGFLKQQLPDYMVPSAFVVLDSLPLTPNGKVDRRALPAPDQTRPELAEAYVGPRTPVEEALCGVWSEVLGLERVGVRDNFFELGGHSLLLTQVISRVRESLKVDVPMRTFFQGPTVDSLAVAITQLQAARKEVGDIEQLLEQLDRLSEEELQALIEEETAPPSAWLPSLDKVQVSTEPEG